MKNIKLFLFLFILFTGIFALKPPHVRATSSFTFEKIETIEGMVEFMQDEFSLGDSKEKLQNTFVDQGKATLIKHPHESNVEKYLYDINLCNYYVWRWNISADYNDNGKLQQAYLNGNPIFKNGTPKRVVEKKASEGEKASIYKGKRPRPEAHKGEKSLAFILFDGDSNKKTLDDQALIGSGPSRPNPANMGKMLMYKEVDPWRSIFDFDKAKKIVPYSGDCKEADELYSQIKK